MLKYLAIIPLLVISPAFADGLSVPADVVPVYDGLGGMVGVTGPKLHKVVYKNHGDVEPSEMGFDDFDCWVNEGKNRSVDSLRFLYSKCASRRIK